MRRDESHAAFFFVDLNDSYEWLRRSERAERNRTELVAGDGDFGRGDFEAYQTVIRVEEEQHLEI